MALQRRQTRLSVGHASRRQTARAAARWPAIRDRARGGAWHRAAVACRTASPASANWRCRPDAAPTWWRLGPRGEIWIVEIKSSVADFRADQKWQDYRLHCDRLFFATTLEVPCEIFPPDTGLIVADAFGASIACEAPEHRLHGADPQSDDAGLRARRRAAAAVANRSGRALREAGLARRTCRRRSPLARRAFGQNALQGAPVHVEPARGLRDVAAAQFVDALDVLPAHAVGRHRIFRRLDRVCRRCASSAATTSSASAGLAR